MLRKCTESFWTVAKCAWIPWINNKLIFDIPFTVRFIFATLFDFLSIFANPQRIFNSFSPMLWVHIVSYRYSMYSSFGEFSHHPNTPQQCIHKRTWGFIKFIILLWIEYLSIVFVQIHSTTIFCTSFAIKLCMVFYSFEIMEFHQFLNNKVFSWSKCFLNGILINTVYFRWV